MITMKVRRYFSVLMFSMLSSYLVGAGVGYDIPRITEDAINAEIPGIEKVFTNNDILRKALFGVGVAAVAGGTAHILYRWFFAKSSTAPVSELARQVKDLIDKGNQSEAIKVIAEKLSSVEATTKVLRQKLQSGFSLKNYFNSTFFSTAKSFVVFALHSIATSVIWNQVIKTQRYCQTIFKDRDLKWYLAMHSHVGTFISYEDMEGNPRERFDDAQLLQELKGVAKFFDQDISGDKEKTEQVVQMIRSVTTSLVEEITRVIAYMNYTASTIFDKVIVKDEVKAQKKSEALSYAHYLCSHANTFAQSMEESIEKKINDPRQKGDMLTVVNKFANDFKTMVIGFNRIQQYLQAIA